jgi:hypothetical protein
MEPKGLLLCSQEPATGPYPEADESSPHPHILFLFKICCKILLFILTLKFSESTNVSGPV